jgi:uncharacterized RDD family membrane protein YckC
MLVPLAVAIVYFGLMEATRRGASPGKLVTGLRVCRPDGSRAGVVRAVARTLFKPLSAAPLMAGFAIAGLTARKQALHDLLTGTIVVRR